jgi:hypothetical protein
MLKSAFMADFSVYILFCVTVKIADNVPWLGVSWGFGKPNV